ncbi:uncharacterized protein [Euphorbia lathyris]|uniref:uncharacterized protein n=1 Tax=Euphorbia lathyris TaxID=212925 RepID=UPI003313219C
MEKEAVRRRMKIIGAHFEDISLPLPLPAAAHLLPMKCSGSFSRCDNRMYYARQASDSQPFFMRHHSTQQGEKPSSCSAAQPQPLYSRAATVEPNSPNLQSTPKQYSTQLPHFARPTSIISHSNGNEWSPRMDVAEGGRSYIITVELPGVNANHITVELNQTTLRIMGKRCNEWSSESICAYHKREIIQGPYQVSWPLPSDANKDSVSAEFLDGILRIIVPKL